MEENNRVLEEVDFQEGLRLLNKEEFTRAYEKFSAVVAQNPRHKHAFVGLGLCLEKTGKLQQAVKTYRQAIKNDPGNAVAVYNLGVVYLALNKNIRAWWQFRKTLKLQPGNPNALHNLGLIYYKRKRYKKAIKYLLRATGNDSEKEYALYYLLAKCFREEKKEDDAILYLSRSLDIQADFFPSLFELLQIYQSGGDWFNFFEIIRKISRLCPDNQVLHNQILTSLQAIKDNKLKLNGVDESKLESLIAEFRTPQLTTRRHSRIRDLKHKVIISEPDEDAPKVYH